MNVPTGTSRASYAECASGSLELFLCNLQREAARLLASTELRALIPAGPELTSAYLRQVGVHAQAAFASSRKAGASVETLSNLHATKELFHALAQIRSIYDRFGDPLPTEIAELILGGLQIAQADEIVRAVKEKRFPKLERAEKEAVRAQKGGANKARNARTERAVMLQRAISLHPRCRGIKDLGDALNASMKKRREPDTLLKQIRAWIKAGDLKPFD